MRFSGFNNRSVPFALLAICILAFGLLVPWPGYYQDDWYQVWFGRAFGSGVFVDYYSIERPFIAGIYMLTMPLVGTSPLSWQVFGVFSRFLSVLAVYWLLRVVWPERRLQAVWAAALFAVYPAFPQQYASVIYSHYFLQMAVQMLSLGTMVLAADNFFAACRDIQPVHFRIFFWSRAYPAAFHLDRTGRAGRREAA